MAIGLKFVLFGGGEGDFFFNSKITLMTVDQIKMYLLPIFISIYCLTLL